MIMAGHAAHLAEKVNEHKILALKLEWEEPLG
jgi:hypothetical protein